jgi:DNA-binding CsgD family transcriptional regulator/PAS domain-containing protein
MMEAEQLSQLIGDIYDAALDPALWVGVLGRVRDFVAGQTATLFWKDAVGKSGNVYYGDGGLDPHYTQLYFDKYVKLDPATTGQYFAELEKPISTVDLLPYDDFLETRFYREWAKPQGLVDFASAVLDKSVTSAAMFGVFRHERHGIVDDETRRRMRLIVPHVRRAVLIGRAIDLKTAEAASFADTLDGLSAGMFLVDASARIIHANASGHAMLGANDFLRAAGGRLVASDGQTDQALREIFAAAGSGDAAVGIRGIAVPLKSRDGECYVAHVLPLTSGERRRAGTNYAAVAALFVHKAALDAPSPPEVIAKTFGLTPSELRVLLGIVEVGGVSETAIALGIAETTVKTHLHHLFAKTGTTRQAELVKLVAGFSNPLVRPMT